MSLILNYKFNSTDVTLNSTGDSFHLTNNGVTSTVDETYGNVALFDGSSHLELLTLPDALQGTSPRTVSLWINRSDTSNGCMFHSGTLGRRLYFYFFSTNLKIGSLPNNTTIASAPSSDLNTWFHYTITSDGTNVIVYQDGVEIYSVVHTLDMDTGILLIGKLINFTTFDFYGKITDFRVYDYSLSSTEALSIYSDGPNPTVPLTITPRVSNISVSIASISGAIGYRLTSQITGNDNIININFVDLQQTISNLTPETEYTFRLYSTTDGSVYTLVETAVITTLSNDGDNYEKNDFIDSDGIYDLSEFNNVSVDLINDVINDVFDTDDRIEINLDGIRRNSKFVNLGDTIDATDTTAIVVPFSPTSGSGQSVSLTLSNSTSTIEYNNLTETLNIESGNYQVGNSLILDGKKVTILEI